MKCVQVVIRRADPEQLGNDMVQLVLSFTAEELGGYRAIIDQVSLYKRARARPTRQVVEVCGFTTFTHHHRIPGPTCRTPDDPLRLTDGEDSNLRKCHSNQLGIL